MSYQIFGSQAATPIQHVQYQREDSSTVSFSIKRDDLIDPQISGNKWRKLKYNFSQLKQSKFQGIASFGGAFSNHIAALAAAGHKSNTPTLGFIRTHQIDENNPTLALARKRGMTLVPLSRNDYKLRADPDFLSQLQSQYPAFMFVPEGGSNEFAQQGLFELGVEIAEQSNSDVIACAIGSGGTISGLLDALPNQRFIGVAAVNDEPLLANLKQKYGERLDIDTSTLFGGYGKSNDRLNAFCLDFFKQTRIPIEPVYTGKLFYYLCHSGEFKNGKEKVLAIHTGGLQGLKGLDYRHQSQPSVWRPIIEQLDV